MSTVQIEEFRVGRNYVRKGDRIKVTQGWRGRKQGFETIVISITADDAGTPTHVEVRHPVTGNVHFVSVTNVERKRQTKEGKAIEARPVVSVPAGSHKAGRR